MDPWPRCAVSGLKGPDLVIPLQRQRNLVEPLQQAFAPPRINLEPVRFSGRRNDRLFLEIDGDAPRALRDRDLRGEPIDNRLVDDDRQNSVLEAVGEEDIAEARTYYSANTHLLQRPYRPFARRPATEIRSGNQDFRLPVGLAVQDEFGIL